MDYFLEFSKGFDPSDNTRAVSWYEFLLDPKKLDRHLEGLKNRTIKTPTGSDLINIFLKKAKACERENQTEFRTKINLLQQFSIKTFVTLGFGLEQLEQQVPFKFQRMLLEIGSSQGSIPVLLLHRWAVRNATLKHEVVESSSLEFLEKWIEQSSPQSLEYFQICFEVAEYLFLHDLTRSIPFFKLALEGHPNKKRLASFLLACNVQSGAVSILHQSESVLSSLDHEMAESILIHDLVNPELTVFYRERLVSKFEPPFRFRLEALNMIHSILSEKPLAWTEIARLFSEIHQALDSLSKPKYANLWKASLSLQQICTKVRSVLAFVEPRETKKIKYEAPDSNRVFWKFFHSNQPSVFSKVPSIHLSDALLFKASHLQNPQAISTLLSSFPDHPELLFYLVSLSSDISSFSPSDLTLSFKKYFIPSLNLLNSTNSTNLINSNPTNLINSNPTNLINSNPTNLINSNSTNSINSNSINSNLIELPPNSISLLETFIATRLNSKQFDFLIEFCNSFEKGGFFQWGSALGQFGSALTQNFNLETPNRIRRSLEKVIQFWVSKDPHFAWETNQGILGRLTNLSLLQIFAAVFAGAITHIHVFRDAPCYLLSFDLCSPLVALIGRTDLFIGSEIVVPENEMVIVKAFRNTVSRMVELSQDAELMYVLGEANHLQAHLTGETAFHLLAIRWYLKAASLGYSDTFSLILPHLVFNLQLTKHNLAAAILCQFLNPPDLNLAFKLIQDPDTVLDPHSFPFFWELPILELLTLILSKRKDSDHRQICIDIIRKPELNPHHPPKLKQQFIQQIQKNYLKNLCFLFKI